MSSLVANFTFNIRNAWKPKARLLALPKGLRSPVFILFFLALIIHGATWILLRAPESYLFVTKYHVFSGIEQVGSAGDFLFLAKVALGLLVLGYILALFYLKRELTLAYLIITGSLIVQISFLGSVFLLRLVNGL